MQVLLQILFSKYKGRLHDKQLDDNIPSQVTQLGLQAVQAWAPSSLKVPFGQTETQESPFL